MQADQFFLNRLDGFLSAVRAVNGGVLPKTIQLYIGHADRGIISTMASAKPSEPLLYLARDFADDSTGLPQNVFALDLDSKRQWTRELKTALLSLKASEIRFGIAPDLKDSLKQETELLAETVNMAFSDMNVASRGKLLRLRSALMNIPSIVRSGIRPLPRFDADTHVLICGAGPSLKTQTDLIRKHSSNLVIIAVGHAVKMLMQAGINPDIVVEMDCKSYWNWNHDYAPDSLLLASPSLSPEIAERFKAVLWTSSDSGFFNSIAEIAGLKLLDIAMLKSVTVTAMDFAVSCGAVNIALVGNELCLSSEGATHDGTSYVKSGDEKYLLQVPGNDTDFVQTTEDFDIIRKALEIYLDELAQSRPDLTISNASAGGAFIKNAKRESLESFCSGALSLKPDITREFKPYDADFAGLFERAASALNEHINIDSKILEHSKKLYFELRDSPKGSAKASQIQAELNSVVRSGASLTDNGGLERFIVNAISSQVEDFISVMPASRFAVNGTLLERLGLFRQRYKLMYDLLKDFHADLLLVSATLKGNAFQFRAAMVENFPAFRSYAASFVSAHNKELGDYLFKSSCVRSEGLDFDMIAKDQDIPTVKSVTLPSGKWDLCSRMSFARETEAENAAFCAEVNYDPAKDAVIFFSHINWINALEFAKKYPDAPMMIVELIPEIMHGAVGSGIFWHYLPEKTVVIAADPRFRQWEKLYNQTVKLWKNSGKRMVFFSKPETICIPEVQSLKTKLSAR